jgi:hypothetical protein
VDGGEEVAARRERQPEARGDRAERPGIANINGDPSRQILHEVAYQADTFADPLGGEIGHSSRGRRKGPAGQVVGDEPVDLLGHPSVEAPQARLDVGDRQVQLGRSQGSGQRRVRVAIDEHRVGALGQEDWLEGDEHPGRRPGLASPADSQAMVRASEAELGEERAGHLFVPVLPGVDEDLLMTRSEGGLERCRLDELRPCPNDADDPHGPYEATGRSPLRRATTRNWKVSGSRSPGTAAR